MSAFKGIGLKIRRGDGPLFGFVRRIIKGLMYSNLPLPAFLKPIYRGLYKLQHAILFSARWALNYFYREPAFRSRCASVGKNLYIWLMPDVRGQAEVHIGNNVSIYGHLGVGSGRVFDKPILMIGDDCDLGHNVFFTVNREVIIEEQVNIASNVWISDTDGHPRDPDARARKEPPPAEETKSIRICRKAWIGQGCYIMKGVTIGEGAVIGANSVVVTDVPPFSVAIGNPARVVIKDVRATAAPQAAAPVKN